MSAIQTPLMTTAELLARPDDGVDRWLIAGRLRENRRPERFRSRIHAELTVTIGTILGNWSEAQLKPHGVVLGGNVGAVLSKSPDTVIGLDVAYVEAEAYAGQSAESTLLEAIPVLAVMILAPNDTRGETAEKVDSLRSTGVEMVWVVNPPQRTIIVYRQIGPPQLFADGQEISVEAILPGLRVPVNSIFE